MTNLFPRTLRLITSDPESRMSRREDASRRRAAKWHAADDVTKLFLEIRVTIRTTLHLVNVSREADFKPQDVLHSKCGGMLDNDLINAVLSVSVLFFRHQEQNKITVVTPKGITVVSSRCNKPVCVPPLYSTPAPCLASIAKIGILST